MANPNPTLRVRITPITTASVRSPTKNDTAAATASNPSNPERSCRPSTAHTDTRCVRTTFGPKRLRLRAASCWLNPDGSPPTAASTVVAGRAAACTTGTTPGAVPGNSPGASPTRRLPARGSAGTTVNTRTGRRPDLTSGIDQTSAYTDMKESAVAMAKPRTVASPAVSPARSAAAGIIESISITSSAPAANPSTTPPLLPVVTSAMA